MSQVSIILINYHSNKETLECVKSLLDLEFETYRVFILDNDSVEHEYVELAEKIVQLSGVSFFDAGYLGELKEDFHEKARDLISVCLMRSKDNVGFAAANNIAANYAFKFYDTKFFWFLNNDTVVEVSALNEIFKTYEKNIENNVGLVGSKILDYSFRNKIQVLGGAELGIFGVKNIFYGQDDRKFDDKEIEGYVSGCSMFVAAEPFWDIGGWDESYFMYVEDVDISYKLLSMGYRHFCSSKSIVYHKGGGIGSRSNRRINVLGYNIERMLYDSYKQVMYYNLRNWLIFSYKRFGMLLFLLIALLFVVRILFMALVIIVIDDNKLKRLKIIKRAFGDSVLTIFRNKYGKN